MNNMNKVTRFFTAAAVGLGLMGSAVAPTSTYAGTLPASTCSLSGITRTCTLWAKTGTLSLPGATVNIWGYADSAAGAPTLPGPTLIVTQGETIVIVINNTLAQATSLAIPGIAMDEDLIGAPSGGTATYSFVANTPGTYVYEAGLTANGQKQVAMGLFGALIVRSSTPATAYGSAISAYDDEALVVLSEIDPGFNAAPDTYNLWSYHPTYWLINGKSYPDTTPISSKPGRKVLVRYINAGLETHSMGVLGLRQNVVAIDGKPLTFPYSVVAETIPAGQTMDVIATVPASTQASSKFAVMNAGLRNDNAGARTGGVVNFGGQLTFIAIPSDLVGPLANNFLIAPNPSDGSVNSILTVTIDDTTTGGSNVTAGEYFIDTAGASGTGISLGGAFGTVSVAASTTILTTTIRTLSAGPHTIYVRGKDAFDNWGAVTSTILTVTLDLIGPTVSGLTVTPNVANGTGTVLIQAVASDVATGNGNVTDAEYSTDGGAALPITLVNPLAPTNNLSATVLAAMVAALSDGNHTISVRAKDAAGNWGASVTATLKVDKTGPTTSGAAVTPSATNNTTILQASANDATTGNSNITAAEYFTDAVGANGGGVAMTLLGAAGPTRNASAAVNVATLSEGNHTLFVHAMDAAGNWGATTSVIVLVDKVGPTISGLVVTPNVANSITSVALTGSATDARSNISAAEWFTNAATAIGSGNPVSPTDGSFNSLTEALTRTINVSTWASGTYSIYVRARDVAGNWGVSQSVTVTVATVDLIFANGFESGNFTGWSGTNGSGGGSPRIAVTSGSAAEGTFKMSGTFGNNTGYVENNTPVNEIAYHARFSFNPNNTTTGNNNGNWQTIFSGYPANGGGTLIFSVQYRRLTGNPSQIQVRLNNNNTQAAAVNINNNAYNNIEVWFAGGAGGQIKMYVNNANSAAPNSTLSVANNGQRVEMVRLGRGENDGFSVSGTEYFDRFESSRNRFIGP